MRWGFGGFTNDVVIDSTTRNVGFGTSTPSSKLHTLNDRVISSVQNIKVEQTGSAYYAALGLFNASGGTIIYGRPTGGLEVVNSSNTYAPVYASAFTVSSDIAAKKEIDYLGNDDYDEYITQIRNIQSATYRYNWENVRTRTTPHIGFIAQSLPSAVTAEMSVNSGSSDGQTYVGYNLADMAGLTVMGIKAVDARTLKLDETIKAQQAQIDILIKEIEKLKK